ncbi:MAG: universal stress protein, partial [Planctomycetes bacterium]|nr:universal stress protein [Planctomycetota bacterium]
AYSVGASGFATGMVSEILRLTADERLELTEKLVQFSAGRGAVIMSVGAESIRQAVLYASRLAREFGSDVVLVHAIEPVYPPDYDAASQPDRSVDAAAGTHEAAVSGAVFPEWLERLRAALADGGIVARDVLLRRGKPFVEIITAADDVDASLIVLGARAAVSPNQFALGTTAEKVMRKSSKPVLVIHPDGPPAGESILCPVDFSAAAARALTNAVRLARTFHGKLHVVTVLPPACDYDRADLWGTGWGYRAEQQAAARCERAFYEFLSGFDFRDVQWDKCIRQGEPAEEIVDTASSLSASLIVMGSIGRTDLPHILMGSTALKVARRLPCAMLTVKPDRARIARLKQSIYDIRTAHREGQMLVAQGFFQEALDRFEQCLRIDPLYAPALEGKAAAHERLGHEELAEEHRTLAEMVRQSLWEQPGTDWVPEREPSFGVQNARE